MSFLIYEFTDYKQVIKERIKDLKRTQPKFTLQYLAQELGIQNTFFSKVLNSDKNHFSEDQLFTLGHTLSFLHDEIDYLVLLRSFQSSQDKNRKTYLQQKISNLQKKNSMSVNSMTAHPSQFEDDMKYLMDYYVIVIHVALWIKEIQKKPELLCQLLGIDFARVREALVLLDRMGRIEYDPKTNQVKKLQAQRTHFGKDHPLTRTHQLLMKTFTNQLLFTKTDDKKESIFVTFTTDESGFQEIKKLIQEFTSKIQKVTFEHSHSGVYQLNLDFLEVFNKK